MHLKVLFFFFMQTFRLPMLIQSQPQPRSLKPPLILMINCWIFFPMPLSHIPNFEVLIYVQFLCIEIYLSISTLTDAFFFVMYLLLNACLCIMNHCNKCTKVQGQLLFLSSSDRNCTYVSNFLVSRDLIHIKLSSNHSE